MFNKTEGGIRKILITNNVPLISREQRNTIKHKQLMKRYKEATVKYKELPQIKIAKIIGTTSVSLRKHLKKEASSKQF